MAPRLDDLGWLEKTLEPLQGPQRFLFCRFCGEAITSTQFGCERQGAHRHILKNPFGFTFHVACYQNAPGCSISGGAQLAETWFPGYQWQLACCSQCNHHLGWYYEGAACYAPFFGLVFDYLSEQRRHPGLDRLR